MQGRPGAGLAFTRDPGYREWVVEMNICVFCASSNSVHGTYKEIARNLGKIMAEGGFPLVYGGGNNGLMGALASGVRENGGRIIGVIPEVFMDKGVLYEQCDELVVTKDFRERKAVMEQKADAFIALPGGFGTLEELMEILTLKSLGLHGKPVVILDINRFYRHLMDFFRHMEGECFLAGHYGEMFYVAGDEKNAVDYIRNYRPGRFEPRFS
jgi:cytokinin riboside 5'-monophosphate phosphoribohydrolase